MSTRNDKCPYCPRYFSNRSAFSQHLKRCANTYNIISTDEEVSEIISEIYDMSLDSDDYNQIKEFQDL